MQVQCWKVAAPDDKLSQSANMQMGLSFLKLKKRNLARMAFQQAAASDFDLKLKEQAMYNYAVSVYETSFTPFNGPVAHSLCLSLFLSLSLARFSSPVYLSLFLPRTLRLAPDGFSTEFLLVSFIFSTVLSF